MRRNYQLFIFFIITIILFTLTACKTAGTEIALTPPATPEAAPTPAPYTPAPLPVCDCSEPEGKLAPHFAPKPVSVDTKTPHDTFIAGTPPMSGDFMRGSLSNQYDLSIYELTSGYRDICSVTGDGQIIINDSVVCSYTAQYDKNFNKTYSFTIHKHLKWNNGEPMTARDYVAGLLAYASPEFKEYGIDTAAGEGLLGFKLYQDGITPYFKALRLHDEYNFSVTVDASELPFFWDLIYVNIRPVYMEGWFPGNEIDSNYYGSRFIYPVTEDLMRIAGEERFAPAVTCGPYRFVSYDGREAILERNEYFGACREGYIPYFDYIIQKAFGEDELIDKLISGEVDYIVNADLKRTEPGLLPGNITIHRYPRAGCGFIEFALDFGPARDINVRRAVSEITEQYRIIETALGGEGIIAYGDYSIAQWPGTDHGYDTYEEMLLQQQVHTLPDIMLANALLDGTEWVFEADGGTPFDPLKAASNGSYLRHNANGEALRINIATASVQMAAALEEAMPEAPFAGMDITVEVISMQTLLSHYYNGKTFEDKDRRWHAFHLAADFNPVDDKYWQNHSSLADTYLNSNGIRDDELDRLVVAMRGTEPGRIDEYAALWHQYQDRRRELVPQIPLYTDIYFALHNNTVTQVPVTAFLPYHDVITRIGKFS